MTTVHDENAGRVREVYNVKAAAGSSHSSFRGGATTIYPDCVLCSPQQQRRVSLSPECPLDEAVAWVPLLAGSLLFKLLLFNVAPLGKPQPRSASTYNAGFIVNHHQGHQPSSISSSSTQSVTRQYPIRIPCGAPQHAIYVTTSLFTRHAPK